MTEWELQPALERIWIDDNLTIDGEPLHLIAREVMPDKWEINDASRTWQYPSIDFMFIDNAHNVWLLELKNRIKAPGDAWRAACQVYHRRQLFSERAFSSDTVLEITKQYQSHLKRHGEYTLAQKYWNQWTALKDDFQWSGQINCIVGTTEIGQAWETVQHAFSEQNFGQLQSTLSAYKLESKGNLDLKRFCLMSLPENTRFTPPHLELIHYRIR
ncbi:hypothetical protein [Salidesulfovibrio brasiliensis]|uniref:hypothetical protein n=1 Tax=Salidesulfovibrio brasiliensis TaxID=221711 RepID=UPI0006CFD39E|nr:hypothetical protein [Salidesulfovibrio brasiliensis]